MTGGIQCDVRRLAGSLVLVLTAVCAQDPLCGCPVSMEGVAAAAASVADAHTSKASTSSCAHRAYQMRTHEGGKTGVSPPRPTHPWSSSGATTAEESRGGACLDGELESPQASVAPRAQCPCSSPLCADELLGSPQLACSVSDARSAGVSGEPCLGCDEDEVGAAMRVLQRNKVTLPEVAIALLRPSGAVPGKGGPADGAPRGSGDGAPAGVTASAGSFGGKARAQVGARGDRTADEQQYKNLTSESALAAARVGILADSGRVHVVSKCPLAMGTFTAACHIAAFRAMGGGNDEKDRLESEADLEPWEVAFNQTRRGFLAMSSSSRGRHLFALLSGWYTWNRKAQAMKQHYFVAGREVCRSVFLLVYPVAKTVERVVHAVKSGSGAFYMRDLEGPGQPMLAPGDGTSTTSEAAAWLLAWAENEGERIPGAEFVGKLYVPRVDITDLMREVNELREECGITTPLKYGVIHKAWTKHPTLAHVRIHRDKRNFQQCSVCVNLRALLRAARQRGDDQRTRELQAELRTHRLLQRTERERYYFRRSTACQPNSQSMSLIFDKWSSWTTIVPWFARSPGGAWREVKDDVLQLHVMLVRIHGKPNSNYFFAANDSIKCGGNFTIET